VPSGLLGSEHADADGAASLPYEISTSPYGRLSQVLAVMFMNHLGFVDPLYHSHAAGDAR